MVCMLVGLWAEKLVVEKVVPLVTLLAVLKADTLVYQRVVEMEKMWAVDLVVLRDARMAVGLVDNLVDMLVLQMVDWSVVS